MVVSARAGCRLVLVAFFAWMGVLGAGAPGAGAASTSSSAPSGVDLLGQTPVVHAPSQLLTVVIADAGAAAAPGAVVRLTIYAKLTTRSGLEAAIGTTGPSGAMDQTPEIPLSCLSRHGSFHLTVGVAPNAMVVPRHALCGGIDPVLRLSCSSGCDGVYPLGITVTSGSTTATTTSLVTYAIAASDPLRVAWVLRVAGASIGRAGPTLGAVAANPTVPVTFDVQGSTVARSIGSASSARQISLLDELLGEPEHVLIAEPYVRADLGALFAGNLPAEIQSQYSLSAVALAKADIAQPPSTTVTYGTGPQTPTMADAVSTAGFKDLVVPGSSLAQDPSTSLTWGSPFRIAGAASSPVALASDDELGRLSQNQTQEPALTAAQFLGELAFLHFEQPYLPDPRVVTVVTNAWPSVSTTFVGDVLAGLAANPVLTPVTVPAAFASVPVGANGFPASQTLSLGPSAPFDAPTIATIRFLRTTIDALGAAIIAGESPIPSIEGQLLSAERVMPTPARTSILNAVHTRLADELGNFHIDNGSITLTGSDGSLPITILSSANYTLDAYLRLSSPRISFPQGSSRLVVLSSSVLSVRIPAHTEASGDLPLTATLVSPDGQLLITHADIVVRTTPTSIVGIALTVGAMLVLALWWVRTVRRPKASH
jgi:hypothetical protein